MAVVLVLFGMFALLLALEVPVAISLGLPAVTTIILFRLTTFDSVARTLFTAVDSFSFIAIPLFIIAGLVLARSGISEKLMRLASLLLGRIRGGLAMVLVIVSIFFAGISGSGPADVAAIGAVMIPVMVSLGYEAAFTSALMAAGGAIGIIVPPSIALIIYGVVAEVSIEKLFLAGILPGVVVGGCLIGMIVLRRDLPIAAGDVADGAHWREIWRALKDAFFGLLAPVIILGGIYSGIFTAIESAAVAVMYALAVDLLFHRNVRVRDLISILCEAGVISAQVLIIVACASLFACVLNEQGIAAGIASGLMGVTGNKYLLLLVINIILIAAGCVLDAISIFYIFLPILLPVIDAFGIDRIHFGIIMTVNLAIGQITPPVGVNLFVASGLSKEPLTRVCRAALPIIGVEAIALLIVTYIPQLSLLIPHLAGR